MLVEKNYLQRNISQTINNMNTQVFTTQSPEETIALGKKLGQHLKGGSTVCLTGDLGGGKTHFTKGIAEGLGVESQIVSPTFVLMRVYKRSDAPNLYHLDLYRIKSEKELESMDLDDIIGNDQAIVVIEWPENVKEIIPKNVIWVKFKYIDDKARSIKISGTKIS